MKKIIILLLVMTVGFTTYAQKLTVKQVMLKSISAMDPNKHYLKGNVTIKVLGKSGTAYCASDGVNSYTLSDKGNKITYNNNGVKYEYNKKKNTVTISMEKFSDPFLGDLGDFSKEDFSGAQMELKDGEYIITGKEDGTKYSLVIDATTFFFKEIKAKKMLISLTMQYSNMAYFTNRESLIYNASKFPGAKIVDKRKKK